jgi:RNA polymerase sigma-70 factor (ECF subfamily)
MKPTDTDLDELTLIKLCLQGRRDCYETLVKKYQANVMALAVNILGHRDDALDVVQETFVQAYINLDRFDPHRKFKTWLLSIAVKRCLDLLKKRKTFLKYFSKLSRDLHEERQRTYTGNKNLEDSELFSLLLKRLKHKERIALVLKINENCSARDIAAVLECSESTARVHLFNGIQQLKKLLTKNETNTGNPKKNNIPGR